MSHILPQRIRIRGNAGTLIQRGHRSSSQHRPSHKIFFINGLPPEILAEIFRWYHRIMLSTRNYRGARNRIPLALCGVSAFWRELTLCTPELWSVLDISFNRDVSLEQTISGIITRLNRARTCSPVSVYVSTTGTVFHGQILPSHNVLSILTSFSSVIGKLDIRGFPTNYVQHLFATHASRGSQFPNLHRIRLPFYAQNAPTDARELHFPWSQLTSVLIEDVLALQSAAEVLSLCINLHSCLLTVHPDMENSRHGNAIVSATVLPYLHKLTIRFRSIPMVSTLVSGQRSFCTHFFDAITTPALKDLDISSLSQDFDEHIMSFKRRSRLDLKRFALEFASVSNDRLLQFLNEMHSLSKLYLDFSERAVNEMLMWALTVGHPAYMERLGQSLHTIMILQNGLDVRMIGCILNMVETRSPAIRKGETVRFKTIDVALDEMPLINLGEQRRIKALRQRGTVVEIG